MHFDEHAELRTKIIGLGENSIHKVTMRNSKKGLLSWNGFALYWIAHQR